MKQGAEIMRSGGEVNLKEGAEIMRSEKDILKRGPENKLLTKNEVRERVVVLKRGPEPRSVKVFLKTRSGRELVLKQGTEIMRS